MRELVKIGTALAEKAIPYEQDPPQSKYHILVIGDSSGVGTGASDPSFSTAGLLGSRYPNAKITNLSVNGRKTAELITPLQSLQGNRYDLILIQIGGNDIVRFTNKKQHKKDLQMVLSAAVSLSDQVILLHSGNVGTAQFFPWGSRFLWTRRTLQVRSMYMEVASEYENVVYVDLFQKKADDPFAKENEKFYASDFFHPSDEGYRLWYEALQKEIHTLE